MKFKDIKEFSDKIPYAHMLAPEDVEWCLEYDDIYWVGLDKSGVIEGTYSAYQTEYNKRQDDYFICNADTQQGYWQTQIIYT